MRAFVVLGLVFSYRAKIGLGKRLRSDLFCVQCDVKTQLNIRCFAAKGSERRMKEEMEQDGEKNLLP